MSDRIDYNGRVIARVPSTFPPLLSIAADRNLISPSAYVRQAIREKLMRDGFTIEGDTNTFPRAKAAIAPCGPG